MQTNGSLKIVPMSEAAENLSQSNQPILNQADKAAGIRHPMFWGFAVVVAIAHFLPKLARGFLPIGAGPVVTFLAVVGLPFGFAFVMWKNNKHGWTFWECIACILFVVFTLMIGWWAFLIFLPIVWFWSKVCP